MFNGYEFCDDDKVLEMDGGDGYAKMCTHFKVYTEVYTLKWFNGKLHLHFM